MQTPSYVTNPALFVINCSVTSPRKRMRCRRQVLPRNWSGLANWWLRPRVVLHGIVHSSKAHGRRGALRPGSVLPCRIRSPASVHSGQVLRGGRAVGTGGKLQCWILLCRGEQNISTRWVGFNRWAEFESLPHLVMLRKISFRTFCTRARWARVFLWRGSCVRPYFSLLVSFVPATSDISHWESSFTQNSWYRSTSKSLECPTSFVYKNNP